MPDWSSPVVCPKCGSTDTRFVEPHYEMSVYPVARGMDERDVAPLGAYYVGYHGFYPGGSSECNICGCRFEIAED